MERAVVTRVLDTTCVEVLVVVQFTLLPDSSTHCLTRWTSSKEIVWLIRTSHHPAKSFRCAASTTRFAPVSLQNGRLPITVSSRPDVVFSQNSAVKSSSPDGTAVIATGGVVDPSKRKPRSTFPMAYLL